MIRRIGLLGQACASARPIAKLQASPGLLPAA
jgi:hypothetical protein